MVFAPSVTATPFGLFSNKSQLGGGVGAAGDQRGNAPVLLPWPALSIVFPPLPHTGFQRANQHCRPLPPPILPKCKEHVSFCAIRYGST